MNTNEFIPIPTNLSLTVRKEHKLMIIKKATKNTIRISLKTLFYVAFLTITNIII